MSPLTKRLLIGSGVVGAGGIACVVALVSFVFFIQPRRVLARYDRFVDSYPSGASVDALVADPFVRDATLVTVDGKLVFDVGAQPGFEELRSQVSARPAGQLHMMWTHTPPFGRVNLTVAFSGGKVVSARRGALD